MRLRKSAYSPLLIVLLTALIAGPAVADECVVLLHGLWRTDASMNKMEERLAEGGFNVKNIEYASKDYAVETLSAETIPRAVSACGEAEHIHFVTHSMGGILIRHYLEENGIERLGRVVMLGPPNQGSEVIDTYRDFPGFEFFAGPAGLQLGTGEASVPARLGPAEFELGIIAGTRSINPILSTLLPDTDDGKVAVYSTRLEGMDDHLEMPVTHMFMMRNDDVIEQVMHFLENGRFDRIEVGQ